MINRAPTNENVVSAHSVPGMVLSVLHILAYLIPATTLQGRYYFTAGETEVYKGYICLSL